MFVHLLPLLAPLLLLGTALLLHFNRGVSAQTGARIGEGVALAGLVISALTLVSILAFGAGNSLLLGFAGVGVSARVDVISVIMLLLVGFIGWVVVRFSRTYLDGEERQSAFTVWLLGTLAAVYLLVQSGNLVQLIAAWVATSLCLHQLLLFYPGRIAAQRAAHKKYVRARVSDAALVLAAGLLIAAYGTTDISDILVMARAGEGGCMAAGAAALLALAALLKSAQFPTHGWLTEVMETPTPVSALLHAGVVNAGGFLLIRFADVMLLSPLVLAHLVAIGGFTALFGGVVMLT
ncbi:MAG: proton-conducting transporter membrane subunit, partial [Pseudomonadota bacterium]